MRQVQKDGGFSRERPDGHLKLSFPLRDCRWQKRALQPQAANQVMRTWPRGKPLFLHAIEERAQLARTRRMAQFAESFRLDLANALAGHIERLPDLLEESRYSCMPSRSERSLPEREGWRNLRRAFASIWRMRSRVTSNDCPTSSSVCSEPSSIPKRMRMIFSSRGLRVRSTFAVRS